MKLFFEWYCAEILKKTNDKKLFSSTHSAAFINESFCCLFRIMTAISGPEGGIHFTHFTVLMVLNLTGNLRDRFLGVDLS